MLVSGLVSLALSAGGLIGLTMLVHHTGSKHYLHEVQLQCEAASSFIHNLSQVVLVTKQAADTRGQ